MVAYQGGMIWRLGRFVSTTVESDEYVAVTCRLASDYTM